MPDDGDRGARVSSAWRFRIGFAVAAVGCGGALLVLYLVAVGTYTGQVADLTVYRWSHALNRGGGISGAVRSYLPIPLLMVYAVLAVLAVRTRAWARLGASLLALLSTPIASQILRDVVFERPYLGDHAFLVNTLPSGHVSLAAAVTAAVLLLWPTPARWPLVTAFALLAAAGLASVVAHAHRPSDVVASIVLAGAVTCAILAVVGPKAAPLAVQEAYTRSLKQEGSARITGR